MGGERTLISIPSGVAIVIAARNEADNIASVVRGANKFGSVIVVDDGSTDGTGGRASLAGADVITHLYPTHIKVAFRDGFRMAMRRGFAVIVQMDAGLSHDPNEIPRLLRGLDRAAMVVGSRFMLESDSNQKLLRRLLSRGGTFLVRIVTGMPLTDVTSGFRAFDAKLLEDFDKWGVLDGLRATAHAFQFELLWQVARRGYDIQEVPITYRAGKSSLKIGTIIEALWILVRLILATWETR